MKKRLFAMVMLLCFSAFTFGQNTEKVKGPKIVFEELTHDYGEINKNDDGECVFTFKNEGTEPLILTSVNASCGCTTPSWTQEPVMPGKTGIIKVRYNTALVGSINKSVVVNSNSEGNNREILRIKGNIIEK